MVGGHGHTNILTRRTQEKSREKPDRFPSGECVCHHHGARRCVCTSGGNRKKKKRGSNAYVSSSREKLPRGRAGECLRMCLDPGVVQHVQHTHTQTGEYKCSVYTTSAFSSLSSSVERVGLAVRACLNIRPQIAHSRAQYLPNNFLLARVWYLCL